MHADNPKLTVSYGSSPNADLSTAAKWNATDASTATEDGKCRCTVLPAAERAAASAPPHLQVVAGKQQLQAIAQSGLRLLASAFSLDVGHKPCERADVTFDRDLQCTQNSSTCQCLGP